MEQTSVPTQPTVEVSSFMSRAANAFMSPGELYTEIAATPVQSTSWVIPYIIAMIVGILMTVAIFSNDSLKEQALRPQQEEMQKQVESGKMTQQQADQASAVMSGKTVMVFGIAGVVVIVSAAMFLIPLVLMVVGKLAFKCSASYQKFLEMYGIATLIAALGAIISLLMMYSMDSMYAQPGGAFFLRDSFDRHNFVHGVLASMNIFTIWQTAVVGIGLSKLAGKSTGSGMAVTFGLWLAWVLVASSMGWGGR